MKKRKKNGQTERKTEKTKNRQRERQKYRDKEGYKETVKERKTRKKERTIFIPDSWDGWRSNCVSKETVPYQGGTY